MKRTNVLRNTQGFTLVELAIVLVIIGLIIGGVLKGRELITSGKVKSTGEQMKSVYAASETYRDKKKVAFMNVTTLQSEGLLTGSAADPMKNRFGGEVFLMNEYTTVNSKQYSAVVSTQVPPDLALMVDAMYDDGKPNTGTVRIFPTNLPKNTAITIANSVDPIAPTATETSVVYFF